MLCIKDNINQYSALFTIMYGCPLLQCSGHLGNKIPFSTNVLSRAHNHELTVSEVRTHQEKSRATQGNRAFVYADPKLWNNLPPCFRLSQFDEQVRKELGCWMLTKYWHSNVGLIWLVLAQSKDRAHLQAENIALFSVAFINEQDGLASHRIVK